MAFFAIGLGLPIVTILVAVMVGFVDESIMLNIMNTMERNAGLLVPACGGLVLLGVVLMAATWSVLKPTFPRGLAKRIKDYAVPALESKGRVSLQEIAENVGADVPDVESCLRGGYGYQGMLSMGYFDEKVKLEGGWLAKSVPLKCPYCGIDLPEGAKKCPNCGAAVKK
ncbi:MAG: zinc ribbon domain-containing protein [Candidatus Hadarchaeales archaeon]